MSLLKSSLGLKDSQLDSSTTSLHEREEAYPRLKYEFANMTHSYDKLIAKCNAYQEAAKGSKFEAIVGTYKLGYLDCKSGVAPLEEQVVEENEAKEGAIDEVEANAIEQVAAAS
ncbi:hypothetical protein L3X38_042814 [Prunus dulcis]|uniref:Uncharacterized protein n=1 Tax=Prunus dulcis TaxID=3755 RepID=A0AAD4UVW1_PRUDU|nr:hypothetical protein L3X38_042814 [Prunus dulcis]